MSRPLTTEAAVRTAVVTVAQEEVGKHFGLAGGRPNPTPYGEWYGPGWERALFCAAGWSWCWYQALGTVDASTVIGSQRIGGASPKRRGFVWTVAIWKQHADHRVPLSELRPGDALLYRYATSGPRNDNPVNHVDLVEANHPSKGFVDCIGFNVPRPGGTGDQSMGGGVWRRRTRYSDPSVVGGVSMPAATLADRQRGPWSQVQQHAQDLGLGTFQMSGVHGPATQAAVDAYAATYGYTGDRTDPHAVLAHMEITMSTILEELQTLRSAVANLATPSAIAQQLLAAPFPLSASSQKMFGLDPGSRTVAQVIDHIYRRADTVERVARASADRMSGVEGLVAEIATHTPGIDTALAEKTLTDAVARYARTIARITEGSDPN